MDEVWDSIKVDDMLFAFNEIGEIINCWTWRCFLPDEFDERINKGAEQAKKLHHAKTLKQRMSI